MSHLPPLEPLDCDGDPASVGLRWEKWKRALELYLIATNVTKAEAKRAVLLHMGGLSLQEIYYNIPGAHLETVANSDTDIFTVAINKLDEYFAPKQSRVYERHLFRLIKQETGEKFDKFLVRLRHQSSKCKFTAPDENMIDQITEKCESAKLRKTILTLGDDVTLDKIISEANALETVNRQLNNFGLPGPSKEISVNRLETRSVKNKSSSNSCSRCSGNHPSDSKLCLARDKKCLKCGVIGHYRKQCRTRAYKRKANDNVSKPNQAIHPDKKPKNKSDEVDYIFHIEGDDTVKCILGNVGIEMLIDSGSKYNIIGDETWRVLKSKKIRVENQTNNPDKTFKAYGSENPLTILGAFDATIMVNSEFPTVKATFYVVKNGTRNLLGKDTAIKLGVLKLGIGVNAVDGRFPKFKDVQIHIPIDTSVKPVSQPCRRVPIPLESKINKKIQELVDLDIIEPVNGPSDWISPLVPVLKQDGDIRICIDMRRANQAIIREKHPLPTMDQLMPRFRNAKIFSKLDLKNSFHQLELSEDCRHITTFICSQGLFRYKRLMFGISCAPEFFQKNLERVLLPCTGVVNFIDDIVVYGSNRDEHGERLKKVLQVLKCNHILLNDAKCVFGVAQIEFLGHKLSCDGVKPLDKYIKTIESFREPTVIEEVQSFLGLVNYVGKWIPNLATWTEPLRELLRLKLNKGTEITSYWNDERSRAFNGLKRAITQIKTLGYYDPLDRTQVYADASPVGLGAVLVQHGKNGPRIIAFGNKSLSDREKRYCQTEKEALALVWAVEHFDIYLFGKDSFELISDHKPLEVIFGPDSKPCARIERWVLRLQSYNFKIIYSPGKKNIADSLSRLCVNTNQPPQPFDDENYLNLVVAESRPTAITLHELTQACERDPELKLVKNGVYNNNWEQSVSTYKVFEHELCFQDNLLLRGSKIVIPSTLRPKVLAAAHEGHPGIVGMKSRLRSKVWWPKIDRDAENCVRSCKGCTLVSAPNPPNPMRRRELPLQPWIDIAIDYLGPLPTGHYLLVVIDYYSRYKEIKITKNTDSTHTINILKEIFSRLGTPVSITADNGRQFISIDFENFCKEFGIQLFHSIPYWPQQNGEVERQNRDILKRLRISQTQKSNWQDDLLKYLTMYNSTPHSVTGKPPGELFFRRKFRDKLPSVVDIEFSEVDLETKDRDTTMKTKGKEYADRKRQATESNIEVGEKVYVKNMIKENKLSTTFNDAPHTVVNKDGNDVEVVNDENGKRLRRNIVHLKKVEGKWEVCPNNSPEIDGNEGLIENN